MPKLTIEGIGEFEVPAGTKLVNALEDLGGFFIFRKDNLGHLSCDRRSQQQRQDHSPLCPPQRSRVKYSLQEGYINNTQQQYQGGQDGPVHDFISK